MPSRNYLIAATMSRFQCLCPVQSLTRVAERYLVKLLRPLLSVFHMPIRCGMLPSCLQCHCLHVLTQSLLAAGFSVTASCKFCNIVFIAVINWLNIP